MLLRAQTHLAGEACAFGGDATGFLLGLAHLECVTGLGCAVETQQQHRLCGTDRLHRLVTLVEHSFHLTETAACENRIVDGERAVLHKHFRDIAATLVQSRLDDRTHAGTVRVGFEVEQISLQQHFFQQFLDIGTVFGVDFLALVLTTPLFHKDVHVGQFLTDFVGIGVGFVNLGDGEHHGNAGGLGVVDSLDCLRHHGIVCGDHDDTQVGDLGTAGTHSRESLVTRGIEESDLTTVGQAHLVSTDVLGDTTGLTGDDVRLADVVQQGSLTMVNVTHDGDNRMARLKILVRIGFGSIVHVFFLISIDEFDLETEFFRQHRDVFGIQTLVDGDEKTDAHASGDNFRNIDVHQCSQLVGGDELCHAQGLLIFNCLKFLFLNAFVDQLTFFLSALGGG